jgi:hypothetical protein
MPPLRPEPMGPRRVCFGIAASGVLLLAVQLSGCSDDPPPLIGDVQIAPLPAQVPGRRRARLQFVALQRAPDYQLTFAAREQVDAFCDDGGVPNTRIGPDLWTAKSQTYETNPQLLWDVGEIWTGDVECEGPLPNEIVLDPDVPIDEGFRLLRDHHKALYPEAPKEMHTATGIGSDLLHDKYRAYQVALGGILRPYLRQCPGGVALHNPVSAVITEPKPVLGWLRSLQWSSNPEGEPPELNRVLVAADVMCNRSPAGASASDNAATIPDQSIPGGGVVATAADLTRAETE